MKFIHSLTQDRQAKDSYNAPVNLDYIVCIRPVNYKVADGEYYYCIKFVGDRHDVDWYYNDKLTRDNRLKEILEYIGSKGI